MPTEPIIFSKFASAITDPGKEIMLPKLVKVRRAAGCHAGACTQAPSFFSFFSPAPPFFLAYIGARL